MKLIFLLFTVLIFVKANSTLKQQISNCADCLKTNKCTGNEKFDVKRCGDACKEKCSPSTTNTLHIYSSGTTFSCNTCRHFCASPRTDFCRRCCSGTTLEYEVQEVTKSVCTETCEKFKKCSTSDCSTKCKKLCDDLQQTPAPSTKPPTRKPNPCIQCLKNNDCLKIGNFGTQKCKDACSAHCPTNPPKLPPVQEKCVTCLKVNDCLKPGNFKFLECKKLCKDSCQFPEEKKDPVKPESSRPKTCITCLRENNCIGLGSERCNNACKMCPSTIPVTKNQSHRRLDDARVLSVKVQNCKTCLQENKCSTPERTADCHTKCLDICQIEKPKNVRVKDRKKCFQCMKKCSSPGKFFTCNEKCNVDCELEID